MEFTIKVSENKKCYPSYFLLGYENEKNVDQFVLEVDKSVPKLNWYLMIGKDLFPFSKNKLSIDDKVFHKKGWYEAYVLGSNAKKGTPINSGSVFFNSDPIVLEVRGR